MRGIPSVEWHYPLWRPLCGAVVMLLALAPGGRAMQEPSVLLVQQTETGSALPARLRPLGLERLMEIEVTTVSRKPEKVAEAAAAVYVLSGDDIRRLGVTTIPDALRYVPGVDVARIDNHRYAVSARGFVSEWVSKLQVLIDGRSVYGPLFSGVRWDEKDVLLEDIDRIEVIRGPGSTLWGADAVNGVINVITRSAADTPGWLAIAGGGVQEQGFAGLRYGGRFGREGFFRIYAKGFSRDNLEGGDRARDWRQGQTGFRIDWKSAATDDFTFQGDLYTGRAGDSATVPTASAPFTLATNATPDLSGGNLLGHWTHRFAGGSESTLRMFYDRTDRRNAFWVLGETNDTGDIDFQHRFQWGRRHDIVWGAGYRYTLNCTRSSFTTAVSPADRDIQLFSGFIQDTFGIVPDKVDLIAGVKLEHNPYSGLEVMPNIRSLWRPNPHNTVWAAVSRAVRTPNRFDTDVLLRVAALPDNSILTILGDRHFLPERLLAYELGYRSQLTGGLSRHSRLL